MIIHKLFPTVVTEYNFGREFTQKEKDTFYSSNRMMKNIGNLVSEDKNILDKKQFSDIKNKLLFFANDYIENIIKPKTKVVPYITQSWINYTNTGEWHHKHNHQNSFLSGVFYISCNEGLDDITFYDNQYNQISLTPKKFDRLNSKSWTIKVKNKNTFIFPSSLIHDVKEVKGKEPRISLSFNVFLKGTLGNFHDSTELKLK